MTQNYTYPNTVGEFMKPAFLCWGQPRYIRGLGCSGQFANSIYPNIPLLGREVRPPQGHVQLQEAPLDSDSDFFLSLARYPRLKR